MKAIYFFLIILTFNLSAPMLAGSALAGSGPQHSDSELLQDLSNLTLKCVVRPYTVDGSGQKTLLALRSVCPELQIFGHSQAMITMGKRVYMALLVESRDSDGGDLDDLRVFDSHNNTVAWRHNVPAFDEVLIALTGGNEHFNEVRQ